MPLQLDGQLPLTPMPAVGSSGMKRAMMVRLTEDSLDALSAGLGSGKYPQVLFQFDGTPAITIGDHVFPLTPQRETSAHELYRRAINTRGPSGLRMFGNVTGSFRVQQQDVSTRAQEKLRNSTIAAEQKKSERHTLFIDADLDPKTAVNGKKGKMSLGDNAVNRLAVTKDARAQQQQRSSMSTPVNASNGPSTSSALATTRIPPSRAAAAEQTRPSLPAPRPKLAKNAGAAPLRSHDGETLTSTFRGGMLTKETKKPVAKAPKDRPAATDAAMPKASSSKAKMVARDWDGEPDDLPLAITTRTAGVAKTANGNARSSLTGTSTAKSRESTNGTPLAKARESASGTPTRKANGQSTSSSAPTAAVALANAIAAASSTSTTSASAAKKPAQHDSAKRKRAADDDDYPAPGSKKSAQKNAQKTAQDSPAAKRKRPADDDEFTVSTSKKSLASEAGTIKRKRPLANDDDEYDGPGVIKKRKSVAASSTSLAPERAPVPKTLNGILRKPSVAAPKKEPSRSPNPPPVAPVAPTPPVVTKLPRANDEPTLSKSLRFKKEERKVEIPTPNTSASSISVKAANGSSRRRSTPTFTSSEDEEEEAEEGELRPAKKPKLAHSSKPAPPKKPISTWSPKPLPTDHTKLRARYHATYVEYTYCQHVFATQRDLVQRRLERPDGAQTDSDSEIIGEDELQKMKLKYSQVTDELTQIRKILYPEVKKE